MKYALQLFVFLLFAGVSSSQIKPIGFWRDHLSFQQVIAVDSTQQKIIAATPNGYFIYDPAKNEFQTNTKSNGLSDVNIRVFSKQPGGNKIIIAYEDGNIDVLSGRSIRNIPFIKLSKIVQVKKIYSIYWNNQRAFLSTNFGVVVLDPDRFEIVDTYFPSLNGDPLEVFQTTIVDNKIYANTSDGIKIADIQKGRLNDFSNWNSFEFKSVNTIPSQLCDWLGSLVAKSRDSVFMFTSGSWKLLYASKEKINDIKVRDKILYIFESNGKSASVLYFSSPSGNPQLITSDVLTAVNDCFNDGVQFWLGDQRNGLVKLTANTYQKIFPNAPAGKALGQSEFKNGTIAAVAGDQISLVNTNRGNQFYVFKDEQWKNYIPTEQNLLSKLSDFTSVVIDDQSEKIFIGTKGTGLLTVEKGDRFNTIGISSGGLQADRDQPGICNVAALAFDASSNLWITNPNTNQSLVVKKKDGTWKQFAIPFSIEKNLLNKLMIDAQGRKWMTTFNASGLICFDDNNTIDATNDDQWKHFQQGTGRGNLPSSNVLSVAEDQSGNIWVGTDRGIGIIQCGSDLFRNCEATLPVVQQDNFAGLLLTNESINDIKVDGADRKWIASKNGVWLLSPDGQKVIQRFTSENSKLLNDEVYSIVIQQQTGEVFFMTASGISSYRSTATTPVDPIKKPIVFPNPVPSGFNGTIGIRALPFNSWVKITELDGRLVFQTRSLGGQAIWNGRNYKGERVHSGVYLIVVSNQDNTDHVVGKIFFIQ